MTDEGYGLVGMLAAIALAIALAVAIIRPLRRRSYRGWPRPFRWVFLALTGLLAATGGLAAAGLARTELSEHRVGLGTGIVTAALFAAVKGVFTAWRGTLRLR